MSPELILTVCMFSALIIAIMLGISLAFAMGGIAVVTAYILWGYSGLFIIVSSVFKYMWMVELAAVPLFVFMGVALAKSSIAKEMYEAFYVCAGSIRGGLAVGSCGFAAALSAMTGSCAASTLTAGLVGIPPMRERKYNESLIFGTICSAGSMGVLIPPSITLVIIGMTTGESIGKLFAGGMTSGLFIVGLFIAYILILTWLKPDYAPARVETSTLKEKIFALRTVILPGVVIISVLGSIFVGIATPTEAAAIGCVAVFLCVMSRGEATWAFIRDVVYSTSNVTGMVIWIMFGAAGFVSVYCGAGGAGFIQEFLLGLEIGRWGVFAITMIITFILGCFLDPVGIILLTLPIFYPVIKSLGFHPVWYCVLVQANLCLGYITPPFGYNLFYLKTLTPETPMRLIYKSIMPFVAIMIFSMIVMIIFPGLITWLPGIMIGNVGK
ncbi:MAG: TRAP transporter large permease subunit [Desulfatirhabdiaceae bacterium]